MADEVQGPDILNNAPGKTSLKYMYEIVISLLAMWIWSYYT